MQFAKYLSCSVVVLGRHLFCCVCCVIMGKNIDVHLFFSEHMLMQCLGFLCASCVGSVRLSPPTFFILILPVQPGQVPDPISLPKNCCIAVRWCGQCNARHCTADTYRLCVRRLNIDQGQITGEEGSLRISNGSCIRFADFSIPR